MMESSSDQTSHDWNVPRNESLQSSMMMMMNHGILLSSCTSLSSYSFVTVYEFVFRESKFTTVQQSHANNNETIKDYVFQKKSHGWLEYSKQSNGFLQCKSEEKILLLDRHDEMYALEKLFVFHFTCEKPIPNQMLSRKIPEFIVASYGSFHVSCKLNKLGVFMMDDSTWCELQEIRNYLKLLISDGQLSTNLKRNDLMLYPFLSRTSPKDHFMPSLQGSLFKVIFKLDAVREIVTNQPHVSLQSQLAAQEKVLEKLENQLDHYDQLQKNIESALNISFSEDPVLLRMAFTLPSYCHANTMKRNSHERLEFMGDAVVNLASITYIVRNFRTNTTKKGDWVFANMVIIGNQNIGRIATEKLSIPPFMLNSSENHSKKSPSDVFEAIIGGYFLSKGLEKAMQLAEQTIVPPGFENTKIFRKFDSWIPDVCENGKMWTRDKDYSNLIDMSILQEAQDVVGHTFKNIDLLQEALIHHSFNETFIELSGCPEQKVLDFMRKRGMKKHTQLPVSHLYNSEQMKMLGAALLKFLVVEFVYKRFTEAQPKTLTLVTHRMIGKNDEVFQKIFHKFRFDRLSIRRAPIEDPTEVAYEVFLGILGAMYIDNNYRLFKYDLEKEFLSQQHLEELENSTDLASIHFLSRHDISVDKFFKRTVIAAFEECNISPYNVQVPKKSDLQHRVQLMYKVSPTYSPNTVDIDGLKLFTCTIQVSSDNQIIELAKGCSRTSTEEAESIAIDNALENITTPAATNDQK
ncbi:hypothetical protein FDP41_012870 [Naegleria fowleri]|uniref:RNase III domain-containing protein n=1 Tax=Naegleria fowleri TaxID=5763 RepID=A0A6A5C2V5_NAEFO|nr:uncharacterized protein FDP41_012870 [Naegleria fowleri]KAF0981082.1 hypothetical protein FDP41_012870 [Naegleria fowleri]CAG4716509.1 unnamed protein product [Naegleria fowleri]